MRNHCIGYLRYGRLAIIHKQLDKDYVLKVRIYNVGNKTNM